MHNLIIYFVPRLSYSDHCKKYLINIPRYFKFFTPACFETCCLIYPFEYVHKSTKSDMIIQGLFKILGVNIGIL